MVCEYVCAGWDIFAGAKAKEKRGKPLYHEAEWFFVW